MRTYTSIRIAFAVVFAVLGLTVVMPEKANAEGVQIRPLLYRERLQAGEVKKGFVDVSNASHAAVTLQLRAKSFRQSDSNGSLQFMDSDAIRDGIRLDLTEVSLGPREAIRVYFVIDSKKLPQGDVFAAVFAATKGRADTGLAFSTQVGTLLIVENGNPGPRKATLEKLDVSPVHISNTIMGTAVVRNTAPANQPTAFFPDMKVTLGPWLSRTRTFEGPLVFAGNTRQVKFTVPADNRFGVFKVTLEAQGSMQSTWVLLVTGYWRWVVLMALLLPALVYLALKKRRVWSRFLSRNSARVRKAQAPARAVVLPANSPPSVSPQTDDNTTADVRTPPIEKTVSPVPSKKEEKAAEFPIKAAMPKREDIIVDKVTAKVKTTPAKKSTRSPLVQVKNDIQRVKKK